MTGRPGSPCAPAAGPPRETTAWGGPGGCLFLVPRQLPRTVAWLVGRDAETAALDQVLAGPGPGPVTVVICGLPGVGKTALAAWWLRRHRDRFADGQVHARLGGPHGPGEAPGDVLGRWLRALGVPGGQIPGSQPARVRLWRSVTSGRHLAVMVDDAPSAAAAAVLQPGTGPARMLVTSRRTLTAGPPGTFAPLRLRPLTSRAARTLLARELDDGEPAAVRELARACGGLPLALRCAAGCLPGLPAAGFAALLTARQAQLAAQGVPRAEARARAMIETAASQLEPAAAHAYRLLSLCPGPEFSTELAAAVLGTSTARAGELAGQLARAALLEPDGHRWWRFHDLCWAHARDQARSVTGTERHAATGRMLTWYAQAAIDAHAALPAHTAAGPRDPATRPQGMTAWADRHQPAMTTALRAAAARGDHPAAVRLAQALWPLLSWHGCHSEQLTAARFGLRAARACGDAPAEARLLAGMGAAQRQLGRTAQAAGLFRRAARIWVELGDDAQLAATLGELGRLATARDRPAEARKYHTQAKAFRRPFRNGGPHA